MISEQRKIALQGLAEPRDREEAAFQRAFVDRCGYSAWPVSDTKPADTFPADYEAACLRTEEP